MTDINGIQFAIQKWHEAHTALMNFFEDNNILEAANFAQWLELREAEDIAREEVDLMIEEAREEDEDEDDDEY